MNSLFSRLVVAGAVVLAGCASPQASSPEQRVQVETAQGADVGPQPEITLFQERPGEGG